MPHQEGERWHRHRHRHRRRHWDTTRRTDEPGGRGPASPLFDRPIGATACALLLFNLLLPRPVDSCSYSVTAAAAAAVPDRRSVVAPSTAAAFSSSRCATMASSRVVARRLLSSATGAQRHRLPFSSFGTYVSSPPFSTSLGAAAAESASASGIASASADSDANADTSASDAEAEAGTGPSCGWVTVDWGAVDVRRNVAQQQQQKQNLSNAGSATSTSSSAAEEIDPYAIATYNRLRPTPSPDRPSPVELIVVRDRMVYVKRDDLLRLRGSNVSGNKARKVLALNELPVEDFPDAVVSYGGPQSNAMLAVAAVVHAKNLEGSRRGDGDNDGIGPGPSLEDLMTEEEVAELLRERDDDDGEGVTPEKEIDVGGDGGDQREETTATTTTKAKTKRFVYYTKKLPRYLRKQPSGNLLRAMFLGMELIELDPSQYAAMFGGEFGGSPTPPPGLAPPEPGRSLWMPQGGACGMAVPGARILAEEIVEFWSRHGRGMPLSVCVPGGTCSTAVLLHREINDVLRRIEEEEGEGGNGGEALDIRVVVVPCVGDDKYAQRQMMALDASLGGTGLKEDVPTILRPLPDVKYGKARKKLRGYFLFGEPAAAIMQTFLEMKDEHGLYLDLLYGAPAWSLMLQHWKATTSTGTDPGHYGKKYVADDCPIAGRQVMYVHSGGFEGISSQLTRYKRKGIAVAGDIQ